jgi:hypothetical protein
MRTRFLVKAVGIVSLVAGCMSSAFAAQTFFTQASFLSNVNAGYFSVQPIFDAYGQGDRPVAGFGGDPTLGLPPATFSGNGFTVTAETPPVGIGSADFILTYGTGTPNYLTTNNPAPAPMTLTFSGNVTAVGGNFFTTDFNFDTTPGTISLTLSDGTFVNLSSTAGSPFPFVGFTATEGRTISSLAFSIPTNGAYTSVDNLIIGSETAAAAAFNAPEPGTLALLVLGGLPIVGLLRRRTR